jgi:RNA polymerase sigma factor (TIGR02999 family)
MGRCQSVEMQSILLALQAMHDDSGDVTIWLERWRDGDQEALHQLIPLVYDALHRIADSYMRRERDEHTLQSTALINEVYLRLQKQRKVNWGDRKHFLVFAAMMMRNVLTDYARAQLADRRGGETVIHVPLTDESAWVGTSPEQVIDVANALKRLEALDERKARVVELRYFLAMTMDETADTLNISLATAERDLKFARSWLNRELNPKM